MRFFPIIFDKNILPMQYASGLAIFFSGIRQTNYLKNNSMDPKK